MSDEEAYELMDKNISVRKNMEHFKGYCKDKGLTLREGRLRGKKLKEEHIPHSSINPEMEKETHPEIGY